MGCGASTSNQGGAQGGGGAKAPQAPPKKSHAKDGPAPNPNGKNANSGAANGKEDNGSTSTGVAGSASNNNNNYPGKNKYLIESGANMMEVDDRKDTSGKKGTVIGILLVFGSPDATIFSARDHKTGNLFVKEIHDSQLVKEKESQNITHGWAPFFKSIASDVTKSKAKCSFTPTNVTVEVQITPPKDGKGPIQPYTVRLESKPKTPQNLFKYFLEPITKMLQKKRQTSEERDKELRYAKLECDKTVKEAAISQYKTVVERLTPNIRPLRDEAATVTKQSTELQQKVAALERKVKRLKQGRDAKHPLDALYEEGGARHFGHLSHADEHFPRDAEPNPIVLDLIKEKFPLKAGEDIASITKAPTNPMIQRMLEKAPDKTAQNVMQVLTKLDSWDLSVFELDQLTNGGALFHITYALLYKLNLVQHFGLNDQIVRNFLTAVQSGYHPNPYHNAIHGADVTQINYFIMTNGGLMNACHLSMEDQLAGLLAGAIHDFDHPGFNNNFHTRTSAFLSTLYNDKSILENHHLACIFELTRLPKYNIFAPLPEDKKKDVRDTMIEMVLSTDMGNHAKIFAQFRRRLSEGCEWSQRREDVRLALSMAIKMADISNSGRPSRLYLEWAKNIAAEFYNQGDAEAKLKLPISPFMDRRKDKTDFPKGQISFMNYIVVPMFEAIAEFLPSLEFVLKHCQENKEYWQNHED